MKSVCSLFAIALPAAFALVSCGQPSRKAESPPPQESSAQVGATSQLRAGFDFEHAGQPAPDLKWETDADGHTEGIADILAASPGQPVLVNLWASWCAPCLKELPTLDKLAAETRGKLRVIPISQDMAGWAKVTPVFTRDAYPNLRTGLDSSMQYGRAIGAQALPVSILYDAEGREVWRYLGDTDWMSAEARAKLGV